MVRGIWSTGSVTDSRTGTDVRFGGGESPRGREAGQWRGDLGQRTLSRARGRERMSALGGSKTPPSSGVDFHFFLYLVFASATCLSGSRGK